MDYIEMLCGTAIGAIVILSMFYVGWKTGHKYGYQQGYNEGFKDGTEEGFTLACDTSTQVVQAARYVH